MRMSVHQKLQLWQTELPAKLLYQLNVFPAFVAVTVAHVVVHGRWPSKSLQQDRVFSLMCTT